MFSIRSKLNKELDDALSNKIYKTYRVIIQCKNLQKNVENKISSYKGKVVHSIESCKIISAYLSPQSIERLIEYPEVQYITFDSYGFLCGKSVQSANGINLNSDKYRLTGKGIGIALVDSGVYPHPDLLNPHNKVKLFVDLINGYKYPYDDNGHGTFQAGIICGSGTLSQGVHRGIAENSSIYCYKAFNSTGKAYVSDIMYCIEDILSISKEHNIKVMCLPFEIPYHDKFLNECFHKLFFKAVSMGIVPVVPSGSGEGDNSIMGIASLENCITVSGIDTSLKPKEYRYSSRGPVGKLEKPDMTAACVDICSLNANINYVSERNDRRIYPGNLDIPYTSFTGTSCAAAYVSGLCALLFENNNNLSFKDIVSLIKVSCELIDIPKTAQGCGTININKLMP